MGSFDKILSDFEQKLRKERLADSTIKTHMDRVSVYLRYCDREGRSPRSEESVETFLAAKESTVETTTLDAYRSSLRVFLARSDHYGDDATARAVYHTKASQPVDVDLEWDSGEDYYRERLVSYLGEQGYQIEAVANKATKGRDIIVKSHPRRIVEVKGFPSQRVSLGHSKGKKKSESQRRLQALLWVWDGIRQLAEHKCANPNDEIALGLPDKDFYVEYLDKIGWLRKQLSMYVYLISDAGINLVEPR